MRFRRLALIAAVAVLAPAAAGAQDFGVAESAETINTGNFKLSVNPMFVFPGCICFPVMLYAVWLYVNGVPEMQKKAGITDAKDEKILHLVLMLVLMPVGMYIIQQKLNELWAKAGLK